MNLTNLQQMRTYIAQDKPKKLREGFTLKEPLRHGWLLNYLLPLEIATWGRWEYWSDTMTAQKILDRPIPQIDFAGSNAQSAGRKSLETALNVTTKWGSWQGWGSFSTFEYFLDWLLFGFGDNGQKELPKVSGNVDDGASERLYQIFNLEPLIAYPYDYFGDIFAENSFGRGQGFFPTPVDVCSMMVKMQMESEDMRDKTVMEPCCGTGRMLIAASNYSLRLYGVDINSTVVKACRVNAYLYAPWLARGFGFLERKETQQPAEPVRAIVPELTTPQMEMELV